MIDQSHDVGKQLAELTTTAQFCEIELEVRYA